MKGQYNLYMFRDKDPIIDRARTVLKDSGKSLSSACVDGGLRPSTGRAWFFGKTKRPQFASVQRFFRACGRNLEDTALNTRSAAVRATIKKIPVKKAAKK